MAMGILCGALIGLLYAGSNTFMGYFLMPGGEETLTALQLLARIGPIAFWRAFLFTIMATVGAFAAETRPVKTSVFSSG
jgi:hypothetical protein